MKNNIKTKQLDHSKIIITNILKFLHDIFFQLGQHSNACDRKSRHNGPQNEGFILFFFYQMTNPETGSCQHRLSNFTVPRSTSLQFPWPLPRIYRMAAVARPNFYSRKPASSSSVPFIRKAKLSCTASFHFPQKNRSS